MKGDLLSVNGRLCTLGEAGESPDRMLSANFVWQRIHTLEQRPLHLCSHMDLIETAYVSLYGTTTGLSAATLRAEIATLLQANRYQKGSVAVMLYILPGEDAQPIRILSCEKQLLYKGYSLWHRAEKAMILPYEYPFAHFSTALSLAADTYASNYVRRKSAGIGLAENSAGYLYSAGGGPLFAVMGNRVLTTPVSHGACDSVERRLVIESCTRAKLEVVELPLTRKLLGEYQELFTANVGGIVSIGECLGNIYPYSTASRVATGMNRFAIQDI